MKIYAVIDVQNDFLTGALANPAAVETLPAVKELVDKAMADEDGIIWTRDTHFIYYMDTQEGKHLPIPHCMCKTEGWEIADGIFYPGYEYGQVINKMQFGANPAYLREAVTYLITKKDLVDLTDVDSIEICGYVSSICVVSNALILKALFPETPIRFHAYASAGLTPEDHAAACKVMECCQIEVLYDKP